MFNHKIIILFISTLIVSCNKSSSNSNSTSTTYIPSHMLTYENSDCSGTSTEIYGMCLPNEEIEGFEGFACLFLQTESTCVAMDICNYMNFSSLMSGNLITLNNNGTAIITTPSVCIGGMIGEYESQSECEDVNFVWQEAITISGTWTETANTVTVTSDSSEIGDDEIISFVRSGNNLINNNEEDSDGDGESDSCSGLVYSIQ